VAQRRIVLFVPLAWLAGLTVPPAGFAQTQGSLAVVAGSSTDARGIRSDAVTVTPGAFITLGPRSAAWIGANGTRFENNAWAAGGGAAVIARTAPLHGFALALSTNGAASTTSFNTTFLTGELTPSAEWSWHALTLGAGVHGAVGHTATESSGPVGGFPFPAPGTTTFTSATRTSAEPVYNAQVRLFASPSGGALVWIREDPMRIDGNRVRDRTAGVRIVVDRLTLAGSAGQRRAPDEQETYGTASVSFAVLKSASLDVAAGSYPSNHLTGTARGRYVTAGIGLRFGSASADPNSASAMPRARGATPPAPGYTRFAIEAPSAQSVEIAGDWNSWQPVAADRAENGVWYADVALAPGEYRYSFRVNGKDWRTPRGTAGVADGFGGQSAYITVRGDRSR